MIILREHMSSKDTLIKAAEVYREVTGRALSGVGLAVTNDAKFFDKLLAGGGCTIQTFDKYMAWFKANTPSVKITKKR